MSLSKCLFTFASIECLFFWLSLHYCSILYFLDIIFISACFVQICPHFISIRSRAPSLVLFSSIPNSSMTMLPYSFRYANISAPSNIYFLFFSLFLVLYCIALNIFILYQRISLPFLIFKRLTSINLIFENQFNSKETISLAG